MSSTPTRKPDPRGDATRERLVAAALDLFGKQGFESASARDLAGAAGVPLGAIPYHFGTKEALYHAALERVRERLAAAVGPAACEARAALTESPAEAGKALMTLQGALVDALAVNPEAEAWAKLLLREHLDPSPAFGLVYEDAARSVVELMAGLIARATGREADNEAVLIEAFARMGEVLVFRTLQEAVKRRLGWERIGSDEAERLRAVLGGMHPAWTG